MIRAGLPTIFLVLGIMIALLAFIALVFVVVPPGSASEGQPLRAGYSERLVPAAVQMPSGRTVECVGLVFADGGGGLSCDWEGEP